MQLTTDAFRGYQPAIAESFGNEIDFAMQTKKYDNVHAGPGRYSPPRVTEVISTIVSGTPDPRKISTSFVERQNLTMRMSMRRLTRLTNAFSKKLENLHAAVHLHFAHYNFCRMHRTLGTTPAQAAGIAAERWDIADLLPN